MAKILLAEDDENLGFMICDNLGSLSYDIVWAKNGIEAHKLYQVSRPEICLVDVMMPQMDGFVLAKKIRENDEFTPIIFLTAKSLEEDRLKGFEIGADDYVTKPFSIRELTYRIQVFLRRKPTAASSIDHISFGHSIYNPSNITYSCRQQSRSLTLMEGQLLKLLIDHRNKLVKRETILVEIWGENDYFKGRSLDVFVTRLRKYLRQDECLEIRNHHGVGFSLIVKEN